MAQAQLGTTSGYFTAYYAPHGSAPAYVSVGQCQDGWEIETTLHEQDVHSDAFGEAVAERINQGADYRVTGISIEYLKLKACLALFNQPGAQGNVNINVGLRGTDLYGALALTPLIGTPAATELGAGNSYSFPFAAVGNTFNIPLMSKCRIVHLSFNVLTTSGSAYSIVSTASLSGVLATL
jgi:hypothetical protein